MTALSDFTPDRCAKLAEFCEFKHKKISKFEKTLLSKSSIELIKWVYEFDGKEIELEDFNPTNADAYFLLKRAIQDRKDICLCDVGFSRLEGKETISCCIEWLDSKDNLQIIFKEAETEILALFLAAEELVRRVQDA